jgi:hypothetical protein
MAAGREARETRPVPFSIEAVPKPHVSKQPQLSIFPSRSSRFLVLTLLCNDKFTVLFLALSKEERLQ